LSKVLATFVPVLIDEVMDETTGEQLLLDVVNTMDITHTVAIAAMSIIPVWNWYTRIGMQKIAVTQLRHVTSVNASSITFYSPSDSAVAAMLSPASALKCC